MLEYVRQHGAGPRYRGNRLIFLAADHGALTRFRDCLRTALAWQSIVEDVAGMRLVLDNLQAEQAKKELKSAEDVLPRVARETYKWLLGPGQGVPTDPKPIVEALVLNTGGSALGPEIERTCLDNEWIITAWSPIHLRTKLAALYWKADKPAYGALAFWEDSLRYLFLPRLKNREVLAQAVIKGAGSRDFYGTALGQHAGRFDGFKLGDANVQLDDTLLLIEPGVAAAYARDNAPAPPPISTVPLVAKDEIGTGVAPAVGTAPTGKPPGTDTVGPAAKPAPVKNFHGSVSINATTAKMRLVQVAEEIITALAADPNATIQVRVEIQADYPAGASDQIKRTVSENAKALGFNHAEWE